MKKWNVYCDHGELKKVDEIYAKDYEQALEIARKAWPQLDSDELVVKRFVKASVTFKKYESVEDIGSWHYYRATDAIIKHPTEDLENKLLGTSWAGSIIWETYDEENDEVIASMPYEHGYMMELRRELMQEIKEYNK